MVDPVTLRLDGGGLERLASLAGPRIPQDPTPDVLAAGGVERTAQLPPRVAGLGQRRAGLLGSLATAPLASRLAALPTG